jgi:DNA-binding SARP family transcriptional activator
VEGSEPTDDSLTEQAGTAVAGVSSTASTASGLPTTRPSSRASGAAFELHLLDAFRFTVDGRSIDLPHPARRLLALLAIKRHPLLRTYAAGMLWLDTSDGRAAANLRSVLWRLRSRDLPVVATHNGTIELAAQVVVDVWEADALAHRWLTGGETDADRVDASTGLEGELLPDWYDEWVQDERERYRQLRLHALEAMAERLASAGRWGDAVLAALAALSSDPLRESAHRAVIKVHMAEGNVAEAIRQLRRCERLMIEEVGVPPSAKLQELIGAGSG